jgi:biotin carboxylase
MTSERVLVVGTTADYIEIIYERFPGRALFMTDAKERAAPSPYRRPDEASEFLCDLSDPDGALEALRGHLRAWRMGLSGITSFDCESLELASYVAGAFSFPYVSAQAIRASRNKFISKRIWRLAGLPCPDVALVRRPSDAVRFMDNVNPPVVLKPLTGSGSELIFLCREPRDCTEAFRALRDKLATHWNARMYAPFDLDGEMVNPREVFGVEEFVQGDEYSCDFLLDADQAKVIRMTGKVLAAGHLLGTVLAYILPAELPAGFDTAGLRRQLVEAAHALGIYRAICMLDFIVEDGRAMMIEMSPRPGGDCLPCLELQSAGFDVLGYALDFAEGRHSDPPKPQRWRRTVGLHLFAERAGVIRKLDTEGLCADPRVLECHLRREPGHRVILPPEDYDSRHLGHAIFRPSPGAGIEQQCRELAGKLLVEMEEGA